MKALCDAFILFGTRSLVFSQTARLCASAVHHRNLNLSARKVTNDPHAITQYNNSNILINI
jgi:hypothetical protein